MIETRLPYNNFKIIRYSLTGVLVIMALLFAFFWLATTPPKDFPTNTPINIQRGLSAGAIADLLEEKNVVRSSGLLYLILLSGHDADSIQAGTYLFESPESVFTVANRLTENVAANLITLTLPEGFTVREFAAITASSSLVSFESEEFMAAADDKEGFLFPDTYFVPIDFTAGELFNLQLETYEQKIAPFKEALANHPLGEYGVITLASILEREANDEESMRMVAGILLKRLEENMRLQTDASIEYVLERPLNQLEAEDLELDSPYNTYRYHGLPPTPIGNPGLQAIKAVLEPLESDYYYYLTDAEGTFHYAETYDEHLDNIQRYLR